MAGAAIRGLSKILRKHLKKVPVLGGRVRGTPTKAGLVARRATLRGETLAEQARRVIPKGVKAPKKIDLVDFGVGAGTGALAMHLISKDKKEAKAKEAKKKGKLKKAIEKHEKKTKEKRKKYGKHHG